MSRWTFPLQDLSARTTTESESFREVDLSRETLIPLGSQHPGAFSATRERFIHTGVDLYCKEGTVVRAVEAGRVVAIDPTFTGASGNEDRWNRTQAILVEGQSGVVVYGEVSPWEGIAVGKEISAGDPIGKVMKVMKIDNDRPGSMLHLELYQHGTRQALDWPADAAMPANMRNPTEFLKDSVG